MSFRLSLTDQASFSSANGAARSVRLGAIAAPAPAGFSKFGEVPARNAAADRIAAVLGSARQ